MSDVVSCPKCHLVLNVVTFRSWKVFLCPRCEGTFYDESVLETLLRQPDLRISYLRPALLSNLSTPNPDETDRDRIDCPICQAAMARERYSEENSLLVDRCPQGHGIWLDDGELGQLASRWEDRYSHREPGFWEGLRRLLGFTPSTSLEEKS